MVVVLNFGLKEKKKIKVLLEESKIKEEVPVGTDFEEFRCKIWETMVTLYTSGKVSIQGKNEEQVKEWILNNIELENEIVLGMDETGRGEKEGPLVVAGVLGNTDKLRELRDSKKMKTRKDTMYGVVTKNMLGSVVVTFNAEYVDVLRKRGVNLNQMEAYAMNSIYTFFTKLEKDLKARADGTKFKLANENIEFIVKGDDKDNVIGASSVLAKWLRDNSKDKGKRKTWNA